MNLFTTGMGLCKTVELVAHVYIYFSSCKLLVSFSGKITDDNGLCDDLMFNAKYHKNLDVKLFDKFVASSFLNKSL